MRTMACRQSSSVLREDPSRAQASRISHARNMSYCRSSVGPLFPPVAPDSVGELLLSAPRTPWSSLSQDASGPKEERVHIVRQDGVNLALPVHECQFGLGFPWGLVGQLRPGQELPTFHHSRPQTSRSCLNLMLWRSLVPKRPWTRWLRFTTGLLGPSGCELRTT